MSTEPEKMACSCLGPSLVANHFFGPCRYLEVTKHGFVSASDMLRTALPCLNTRGGRADVVAKAVFHRLTPFPFFTFFPISIPSSKLL